MTARGLRSDRTTLLAPIVLALLALACAGASPVSADDADAGASPPTAPSKWSFDVLPYAWVTGNFGSLRVQGHTVDVDVTTSDVLDLLFGGNAFSASGYFAVAYDRFSVFSDTVGGYAEIHVDEHVPTQLCTLSVRAKDEMKFVIGDVGFGYRLGDWSLPGLRRPLTLGVYAGARYMYLSSRLSATAGAIGGVQRAADVFESIAWADPLLGVRWSAPVLDWASLDFRGDVGGFGASSDLVWGLAGMARVWLPLRLLSSEPYLAAGYRVVAFDRSNAGDRVDLQFRGPTLGAGFTF